MTTPGTKTSDLFLKKWVTLQIVVYSKDKMLISADPQYQSRSQMKRGDWRKAIYEGMWKDLICVCGWFFFFYVIAVFFSLVRSQPLAFSAAFFNLLWCYNSLHISIQTDTSVWRREGFLWKCLTKNFRVNINSFMKRPWPSTTACYWSQRSWELFVFSTK